MPDAPARRALALDLVQGTLDMLILKTLALEPHQASASRSASSR